jgi:membrane-associated phospholipid phosphatase
MTTQPVFRYWLFTLVLSVAAVGLCIAYVDRPLAEFLEAHVRHTGLWIWLEFSLRPFAMVVVAALVFLFGCGICLIAGRPLRPWTETPLLYSWVVIWAVATEFILKRIFGRGWPDPTFVVDHRYGFHFLHGMRYWDSFPSGTATISFAMLAVLWRLHPRWRVAGSTIVVLLLVAVVIGGFHWLSDLIAGAFLGVTVGWSALRLLRPSDRFTAGN